MCSHHVQSVFFFLTRHLHCWCVLVATRRELFFGKRITVMIPHLTLYPLFLFCHFTLLPLLPCHPLTPFTLLPLLPSYPFCPLPLLSSIPFYLLYPFTSFALLHPVPFTPFTPFAPFCPLLFPLPLLPLLPLFAPFTLIQRRFSMCLIQDCCENRDKWRSIS